MHRNQLSTALLAVVISFVGTLAYSATIVIADDTNDYEPQKRSNTGEYFASEGFTTGARVGFQSNFNGAGTFAPGGITAAYFFKLPALAPGEAVTSATFSIAVEPEASTGTAPTFNGDLYILGVKDAIAKTAAEGQNHWYISSGAQGSLPDGNATVGGTVSRVVDNFLVPADFIAAGGSESAPKTANFSSYVFDLYNNPGTSSFTPGTSYLIVRVNPDPASAPTTGTLRYTLSNATFGTNKPTLTLETVPEPASLVLVCMSAIGVLGLRRKE